ncbi:MAG: site-specific DNA-methyltransferase [Phycisphaerae bacterium]|nr:site-specific DNA-methyltransferase [Phycisphaerae bacterium]
MAKRDYPTIRVDKTQLVWPSKFDEAGNVRPVEKTILPFHTVESVNESKADREASLLFRQRGEEPEGWRNRLIWGDNKIIMSSLLPELAGKIDLIYIDPPFATGQDFSFQTQVGDQQITKQASIIEEKAYRDTWGKYGPGRQLESYLEMMYERLILMRELLRHDGAIVVHIGSNVNQLVRTLMDDMFGSDNFRNEIVVRRGAKSVQAQFATIDSLMNGHDVLLLYTRSASKRFPLLKIRLKNGKPGTWNNHWRGTDRPTMRYELFGIVPERGQWRWSAERTAKAVKNYERYESEYADEMSIDEYYLAVLEDTGQKLGFVRLSSRGKPEHYVPPTDTILSNDLWLDIPAYQRTDFPTQKSEALLGRIIEWLSAEDDLVADCFCGSGTTGVVAEKLGRRWIMCDLSKWAIQVTRKRLLDIDGCRPFHILNLGNYQRHKLAVNGRSGPIRYVRFILDLYRAEFQTGFRMLHGKKGRAMVHVGSVDSPITLREIREALAEAKDLGAREVHFLGWDFEMGLHDLVDQVGEEFGVKVRLVSIPRESLEVADPAKEHLRFFDLNYLDVAATAEGRKATVTIKDFVIANPEYLPDEVREGLKKFSDTIDYWAVDWDYKGDTFHNGWQDFRTRKKRTLKTEANHEYEKKGAYRILVKVVDVFGNDTTKVLEVKVK